MKKFIISIALLVLPLLATAGADVGFSINIGQPNYYGQLQLGNMPPPQLIYPNPVIIQSAPGAVYPPLYLRVPPEHSRHWRRYCGQYNACGRPVYFVNDNWYRNTYVPRYYRNHPDRRDYGRGRDRHWERNNDRDRGDHWGDHHRDRH